jgi:hypothetical protein
MTIRAKGALRLTSTQLTVLRALKAGSKRITFTETHKRLRQLRLVDRNMNLTPAGEVAADRPTRRRSPRSGLQRNGQP